MAEEQGGWSEERWRGITGTSIIEEIALTMPKLILNYACIVDVMQVEPKPTDNQRKNRKVILHVDEEDIFDMLDSLNPKNIIKYLDMRGIQHREPANIVVKVKPDASGLKLRHSLKRVATELKNARKGGDE